MPKVAAAAANAASVAGQLLCHLQAQSEQRTSEVPGNVRIRPFFFLIQFCGSPWRRLAWYSGTSLLKSTAASYRSSSCAASVPLTRRDSYLRFTSSGCWGRAGRPVFIFLHRLFLTFSLGGMKAKQPDAGFWTEPLPQPPPKIIPTHLPLPPPPTTIKMFCYLNPLAGIKWAPLGFSMSQHSL